MADNMVLLFRGKSSEFIAFQRPDMVEPLVQVTIGNSVGVLPLSEVAAAADAIVAKLNVGRASEGSKGMGESW